jgi:uncharacterized membrane protein YkoI
MDAPNTKPSHRSPVLLGLTAATCLLAAGGSMLASCDEHTSRGERIAAALDGSRVSLAQALELGRTGAASPEVVPHMPGAATQPVVVAVELELGGDDDDADAEDGEGEGPTFEVETFAGGEVTETIVALTSGTVLSREVDAEDQAAGAAAERALGDAAIDAVHAVAIAEAHVSGRAFAVEADANEGRWEVSLVVGARIWDVEVMAADGTVAEVESEDDEDEDDEDEDDAEDHDGDED